MTESQSALVAISIDQRKNRIRIYKSLLQHLGFPKYIQLLVNPSNKCVAIKVVEKRSPGDQSERIKPIELMVNDCCELYSKSFIKKLYNKIYIKKGAPLAPIFYMVPPREFESLSTP